MSHVSDSVTTCNLHSHMAKDNPFYCIKGWMGLAAAYKVLLRLNCVQDAEDFPNDYNGMVDYNVAEGKCK